MLFSRKNDKFHFRTKIYFILAQKQSISFPHKSNASNIRANTIYFNFKENKITSFRSKQSISFSTITKHMYLIFALQLSLTTMTTSEATARAANSF